MALNIKLNTAKLAPRLCVYGRPGTGKSYLAASFPNPLFLLTEEPGNEGPLHDIKVTPVAKNFTEFNSNIDELISLFAESVKNKEELPFQTIVVDTISRLDHLIINHIMNKEPARRDGSRVESFNQCVGGYNGPYFAAQALHEEIKTKLDRLQKIGVTVIYLAHAGVANRKPPDSPDYQVISLDMNHDFSRNLYINQVEAALYIKQEMTIIDKEPDNKRNKKKMVLGGANRVIVTSDNAAIDCKNRFERMPAEIPMQATPAETAAMLMSYISFYDTSPEPEAPIADSSPSSSEDL